MNNLMTIARQEFFKVVRKKSFWISTLMFPLFMVVVSVISGFAAQESERQLTELANSAQRILVVDESGLIEPSLIAEPLEPASAVEASRQAVIEGEADALFVYPADLTESNQADVVIPHEGFIQDSRFNDLARSLLKQSVIDRIEPAEARPLLSQEIGLQVTAYENGAVVDSGIESLIVPAIAVLAFFLMTSFGVSFFLMSVSEEKESRMMEVILTTVRARTLIWGKILGLVGVVVAQFLLLAVLVGAVALYLPAQLPIDLNLSQIEVSPWQVLAGIFYLLAGYVFLANIMVGVGAVVPTYREASSFSSVFIILSILPIYFISVILTSPAGQLAQILSYLPFTGPMVLLFRVALDSVTWWEVVISGILLLVYVAASAWLALRLFAIGSLAYNERLTFKRVMSAR